MINSFKGTTIEVIVEAALASIFTAKAD